jgi:hypothetical protein
MIVLLNYLFYIILFSVVICLGLLIRHYHKKENSTKIFQSIAIAGLIVFCAGVGLKVASNSMLGKPVNESVQVPSVEELETEANSTEMVDKLRKPDQTREELNAEFNRTVDWKSRQ